jgi:hypothetical protein
MMAISVVLSWMRAPLECSTFQCVERERASAMMLLEMVMRCEVCARHSSGVSPVKRLPEAATILLVAHVSVQ